MPPPTMPARPGCCCGGGCGAPGAAPAGAERMVKVKEEVCELGLPPSLYGGMWLVVSGSSAHPMWLSLRLQQGIKVGTRQRVW